MDSLTHIALGAVIGEGLHGKQLGKRSLWIGALAQSLPDIDFVQSFWLSPVDNLLAHRGFTHSVLFGVFMSVVGAFAASRWVASAVTRLQWMRFIAIELATHLFLDSLNNYGIGWLEPFSHQRISYDVLFVADPFFSVAAGISFATLLIYKVNNSQRIRWTYGALLVTILYLGYAFYNKATIGRALKNNLQADGITYTRLLTTPSPFNNWVWFFAAEVDSGYHVGYRSVFDGGRRTHHSFFYRNERLLRNLQDQDAVGNLVRFSRGYYTVENRSDTLVFNDLRFGQVAGWSNHRAPFAFHYYLNYPEANLLVVQRGRFENWNKKTIGDLIGRIEGKDAE